jgi:8-hydroxy-5-deazaflavin:NADPH oxidoreductase
MNIAIVGGTGAEGFGLTLRLARAGHRVTIGSRDAARAAAKAHEARELLGSDADVAGAENAEAVGGVEAVLVTVPFAGAAEIYRAIAGTLAAGTIVCDCTSPLMTDVGGRASHALHPWQGSAAEFVRTMLPDGIRLVAAFHTVGAELLRALDRSVDSDVLVMGDDAQAKLAIGSLVEGISGMRWIDVGPLQMARIAEQLTPLLISINRRYRIREAGFRLTGHAAWGEPER